MLSFTCGSSAQIALFSDFVPGISRAGIQTCIFGSKTLMCNVVKYYSIHVQSINLPLGLLSMYMVDVRPDDDGRRRWMQVASNQTVCKPLENAYVQQS